MSTVPSEATSTTDKLLANIPDYPGADIILRSHDTHHLRVPKIFIIHNSPVLDELVRRALDSPGDENAEATLPVVQLPESGKLLRYLLTFILPVLPAIPQAHEEIMELLSVAQKYQMKTVLVHIRGTITQQNPLPTQLQPALRIYTLAQKYGLRPEALRSARNILKYSIAIEDLGDKLGILSGASLYELWKYKERVQTILASDLVEFRESGAGGMLTDLRCTELSSFQIPSWIDQYIVSVGNVPSLFDPFELSIAMTRHIKNASGGDVVCDCEFISSQTVYEFWRALESVVNGSFEKAESDLSLIREREDPPVQINSTTSPPHTFYVPDVNLIIRSSDLVVFRVHKLVLAMASPVFKDLFSLPQPSDGESVDGLPMVQLTEDSDLLSCLVSILYLRPVAPTSYEKVLYSLANFSAARPNLCCQLLYLLAACQKYEMAAVQSYIRDKVSQGEFPSPKDAEAFSAYAIASSKGLIPEIKYAARQTLDYPMTIEFLGEGLRLSEGRALQDLANFRRRYRDNLVSCFKSFLNIEESQFNIWIACVSYGRLSHVRMSNANELLPSWLAELYQKHLNESQEAFSKPLFNPRRFRGEYLSALQAHIIPYSCVSCTKVHTVKGESFCKDSEDRLMQALNEALSVLIPDSDK